MGEVSAPPPPAASRGAALVEAVALDKIHSSVRWNKTEAEIEGMLKQVGVSVEDAVRAEDPRTGNRCLHVSAQNGHMDLTKYLLDKGAEPNGKNMKGQTALHMSIEYDFYFQSQLLIARGADGKAVNNDGHEALKGIDGKKEGNDAWDNPVVILKAAGMDPEKVTQALEKIEQADPAIIDKAVLVQEGMKKRRAMKENWDAARFTAIMKKL